METPINPLILQQSTSSSSQLSSAELAKLIQNVEFVEVPRNIQTALQNQQSVSLQNAIIEAVVKLENTAKSQEFVQLAVRSEGNLIEVKVPKPLIDYLSQNANLQNLSGNKINLVFKPAIPPRLSHLQLVLQPAQVNSANITQSAGQTSQINLNTTGQTTPIQQSGNVLSNTLPQISVGRVVQAISVNSNTFGQPQTNASPSVNTQTQQPNQGLNTPSQTQNTPPNIATSPNSAVNTSAPNQNNSVQYLKIVHFGPPSSGFINSQANQSNVNVGGQNIALQVPENANSPIIKATVVSHQQANGVKQPIVQTNQGQLLLLAQADIEVGTKIQFQFVKPTSQTNQTLQTQNFIEPQTPQTLQTGLNVSEASTQQKSAKPQSWPAFNELSNFLENELAPQQMINFQNMIPNPSGGNPRQVTSMMFFFMNALQLNAGAIPWMGASIMNAVKNQSNSRLVNKLIDQLNTDMSRGSTRVLDSVNGNEFQRFTIPIQTADQQLQPIFFYIRPFSGDENNQQNQSNVDGKKDNEVRFLLDLNLSRLGAVQIDGLFKLKTMHMILKLENDLPSKAKIEMQDRYSSVLESLGLEGGLKFQNVDNWLSFQDLRKR